MEWSSKIATFLGDDRLLANLIAVHVGLALILCVSYLVRRLVFRFGERLFGSLGASWMRGVSEEASDAARNLIYWVTMLAMAACIVAAVLYHIAARDVRADGLALWNRHVTPEDAMILAVAAGKLLGVALGAWALCGLVHRLRHRLETAAHGVKPLADAADEPVDDVATDEPTPVSQLTRWFNILERFGIVLVVLGAVWLAARIAHAQPLEAGVRFLMPLVAILLVARLLTLAAHAVNRGLSSFGDNHLSRPGARVYWERAKRMAPFGEKCFEAVVYVWAAAAILRQIGLHLPRVELYSDRGIACIGIFFLTRVVIELLHVLVGEAFGGGSSARPIDQKAQTLVPLLQSVIQYVLYFGSGVVMLEVLDGPTNTILAGAGLLGLAVGLGAQSLVSDVVSGFFILFEGQYLVGDIVHIGDAMGRVEVVTIRHTQIRDEQGKLSIIPNGQIKSVTNFSKGWVNAVVDIKAATSESLDALMRDMAEAGRRLKSARREVLADTVITGLIDLTPGEMTVRAVTRVAPGSHLAIECEYRKLLKDVMDRRPQKSAA